jgi:cell division protein FtsI (penicillin-binding protein 3)
VANVQSRVGKLFAVFVALTAVAAWRTLELGVLKGPALQRLAHTQQVTDETVIAQRGEVTDRNGKVLAIDEPTYDISATPYQVGDPLKAAEHLAPLLGLPQARVLTDLSEHSGFVYLARRVSGATMKAVKDSMERLKIVGIAATPTMRRVYPRGALAGQVLGITGGNGREGLSGLEYADNAILRGRTGERRVVTDAAGQTVSVAEVHREQLGAELTLTLDANIQQRSEAVLSAVGRLFHPKDATAIVMNPNTGEILAMANWPQMNPNKTAPTTEEELENRAVGFSYEPGSTFKTVTISGALQDGLITPSTEFNVPDQIQVADRTIHDAEEHPEEMMSTAQILARSSNVGAIEIGKTEGEARFNEAVEHFGFGSQTGIDLPGEEPGRVLKLSEYSGSSMGNLPIGQGELVTPIQMATAYAAVANGGVLRRAHIVAAVNGKPTPEPAGRRVISERTAAQVRNMLQGVLAPGGTASEVKVPGYELAGKTGTASKVDPTTGKYSETAYVASFIGFAPATNPKLLCAVIVDEPQTGSIFGGTVAAPAFGQIMAFALPYLGIPPE